MPWEIFIYIVGSLEQREQFLLSTKFGVVIILKDNHAHPLPDDCEVMLSLYFLKEFAFEKKVVGLGGEG